MTVRRVQRAARILSLIGAGYLALLLAMYFGQSSLLYLPDIPSRELVASPRDIGLAHEDVHLETADGVRLHGWYLPAPDARGTLLFLHGNAGNISHRLDSLRIFHDLGLAVLIIDYRGYGRSEGRPSEAGLQQDALAAWRHLVETRQVPPERIVVFGRSLGASLAAWLAAREDAGGLILESGFISVPELAAELYWWLPVRWLAHLRHDTRAYVAAARAPVLVAHSPDDEIIPYRHGRVLYDAAPEPKRFLQLRGDHNSGFLRSGADYTRGLRAFLDAHLPQPGGDPQR